MAAAALGVEPIKAIGIFCHITIDTATDTQIQRLTQPERQTETETETETERDRDRQTDRHTDTQTHRHTDTHTHTHIRTPKDFVLFLKFGATGFVSLQALRDGQQPRCGLTKTRNITPGDTPLS